MSENLYQRAADMLEAELGDELVALQLQEGNCFGFNDVATVIWRRLEQPRSFNDLKQLLLDQYDVGAEQCTAELRELMDDLIGRGLVSVHPGTGSQPPA